MNNWILKTQNGTYSFTTFPAAFSEAHKLINGEIAAKGNIAGTMKAISIAGPPGPRGDRQVYSYAGASQMARDAGWLSLSGQINSKEFKKKL